MTQPAEAVPLGEQLSWRAQPAPDAVGETAQALPALAGGNSTGGRHGVRWSH